MLFACVTGVETCALPISPAFRGPVLAGLFWGAYRLMAIAAIPDDPRQATILGHPKGLFVLIFTEMWERFSYYGMRVLLIFFLTQHWLFSDQDAPLIYGTYRSKERRVGNECGSAFSSRWVPEN